MSEAKNWQFWIASGRTTRSSLPRALLAIACLAGAAQVFPAGTVKGGSFESPALGVSKAYRVYLPDGYLQGSRRYPVIYLLHGWGANEDAWTSPALDLAGAADEMRLPAIVVMPDGDRSFYANAATPVDYDACLRDAAPARNRREIRSAFCVRTPRYEDYIARDLVRHIDRTYRTIARREARALSGESAGGLGALHLAFRHRQLFSSVASHSGPLALLYDGPYPYEKGMARLRANLDSYPAGLKEPVEIFGTSIDQWRQHDPATLAARLKDGELAIYFDCGQADEIGFHDLALYFHDRLNELGISHVFRSLPGRHDETLWKEQIKSSLRFHVDQFNKYGQRR